MRFEIVIFLIAVFIIANIHTEGKYVKLALSWKKYYQMIGVAFAAYMLCWLMRKNPAKAQTMLVASNEYLKYLPIDKGTSSMISPILDFTAKQEFGGGEPRAQQYESRLLSSGGGGERGRTATKRSVSETKKKFVAARQNWHCGDCQKQLPAWFEVDHTIRLENGGSNHVDNLIALCRDCHGKKTAIENL
jgi:hypothetical protein